MHIHSKFSGSTSQNMNFQEIERFAIMKCLSVIGTGDFTHPLWMKEIKTCLKSKSDTGLDASEEHLKKAINPLLANSIIKVRNNQIKISAGYDGEYGKIENLV